MTPSGPQTAGRPPPLGTVAVHTDALVRVGPLAVRLLSDRRDFTALDYFSRAARLPDRTIVPDVSLWCLSQLPEGCPEALGPADATSRARGFEAGYYVTDHFGPPLTMWSRPAHIVVVGDTPERVVWPYYIKYLLMRHTVDHGGLFLKAGLLTVRDRGVLIVGRGNAGKTVFATNLALHGGQFLSNSHAIVEGGVARGVASTMRMRACPGVDLSRVPRRPALDPGEAVVDPQDIFPQAAITTVPVRHVCVLRFQGPAVHETKRLSARQAAEVLAQLAFGVNVYRLEEDLLDHLNGDHVAFADVMHRMMSELRGLAATASCHLISTDVTQPRQRQEILEMLGRE